jgi:hypothetical protein
MILLRFMKAWYAYSLKLTSESAYTQFPSKIIFHSTWTKVLMLMITKIAMGLPPYVK